MAQGPTDEIQSSRVICEGGLNTNESTLILSNDQPGAATALVNFESAISGGYRRINGFQPYNTDFEEVGEGDAEGRVLWTTIFHNTTTEQNEVFAARALTGGLTYEIFKLDTGTGWIAETLPADRDMVGVNSQVLKLRHVEFNFGSGTHMIVVDGVNPALWYDGTAWLEIKSANAGGIATPGGDQAVDAPAIITVFKSHIFMGGDMSADGLGRFVHSAPLDPTTWTTAAGGGQLFPGFDAVQLRPFRDELYVFGKRSIKKAIADVTAGFLLKDVTDDLGCLAPDSVLEVGGNLIFFSQDGIRPVAGTDKLNDVELGLLSQNVQPVVDEMLKTVNFALLNGVVIRGKTQFRYTWGSESVDTVDSAGLIGCVRTNKRTGKTWEFGQLTGIRSSCMWSGLVNDREIVLHGDYDGCLYQQEVGSTFNGANILSIYSTPYLDLGATDIRKLLREMNTFINAEGTATIFIGLQFDWGLGSVLAPSNYTGLVSSGASYYDSLSSVYDSVGTLYGSDLRTVVTTKLQGSCFSVKFSFVNQSDDQSFTIQGFIPEFSVKGRN